MKRFAFVIAGVLALIAPTALGYRFGTGHWPELPSSAKMNQKPMAVPAGPMPAQSRHVLYWRDPDGKPAYAANPTKTAEGRDYIAVTESEEPDFAVTTPPASMKSAEASSKPMAAKGEHKIKYYRNPMGLPDTSPTPKKDSMDMAYIPVYEDEEDDGTTVKVGLDKVQRAGVKSEPAEMRQLARPVRAPGIAKIDERTIREVTLRTDGYIEKLYVAEMGKHVNVGDPLFQVYSPDIVKAEVDYKTARSATAGHPRGEAEKDLQGAVQRLENLDVPASVIAALKSGKDVIPKKIDWPSPVSGVVIEKKVVEGQKVNTGDMLFRIADLGSIWVVADVAEQDIGPVKVGAPAKVLFRAFPDETFTGKVTFILHELDMQTRTAKVRIEIANPEHRIRHDMYADVVIDSGSGDALRLAVPSSAILDTGAKQVVLVDKGEGRFEPRPVKLGVRGDGFVEIKEGLADGDKVVTSANFLIDAESNLKAALKTFTSDSPAPADGKPMSEMAPGMPMDKKSEMKPGMATDPMKPMSDTAPGMSKDMNSNMKPAMAPDAMKDQMKPAGGAANMKPMMEGKP